ncbi:MAG TPA: hypothetical protein VI299_08900 [Polyangiales bacterium]
MGIARALRRVKRQAKRGGLGALRTGLGEELRSGSIPAPLQGAARRIAALIDPGSARRAARAPGSSASPAVVRTPPETLRHEPPEHANQLGSDRGVPPAPEPQALAEGTAVDPITVGATPVYDATPIEAAPVDATPADLSIPDATPIVVAAEALVSEPDATEPAASEPDATERGPTEADATEPALSAPEASAEATPQLADAPEAEPATSRSPAGAEAKANKPTSGNAKKKGNAEAPDDEAKEKLAAPVGEAKSAARSGPKGKRSKGHGGKTSKKK